MHCLCKKSLLSPQCDVACAPTDRPGIQTGYIWAVHHTAFGTNDIGADDMLYQWYEMGHAAVRPARAVADAGRFFWQNPFNPFMHTPAGRHAAAACEVFERSTRRYEKPSFGLPTTVVDGAEVAVTESQKVSKGALPTRGRCQCCCIS